MADLYVIYGKLYDTDGTTALDSVTIKLRHEYTNEELSITTESDGSYVFNLGDLEEGWSDGDIVTVYVKYTDYEAEETITIDLTTYPERFNQDITLVAIPEYAGLRYFTVQEFLETLNLSTYDNDNTNGIKPKVIINVGRSIETEIDEITHRTFDNNDGDYYTVTQEYHNANGVSGSWLSSDNPTNKHIYWVKKTPMYALTTFEVNLNTPDTTADWTALTEASNEIKVKKDIGRIEILSSKDYPASGKDQVRITYQYGGSTVPLDIKRLAILMTAKALGSYALQRLNMDVTETSGGGNVFEIINQYNREIEGILDRYKFREFRGV